MAVMEVPFADRVAVGATTTTGSSAVNTISDALAKSPAAAYWNFRSGPLPPTRQLVPK